MTTNNSLALKKLILTLASCWTILMAVLCLFKFNNLPSLGVSGADKYVHFSFHFLFTYLWGRYFWLRFNELSLYTIVKVVLVSSAYGIVLEILQELFTTTRQADSMDVLANFIGAFTALLVFVFKKNAK